MAHLLCLILKSPCVGQFWIKLVPISKTCHQIQRIPPNLPDLHPTAPTLAPTLGPTQAPWKYQESLVIFPFDPKYIPYLGWLQEFWLNHNQNNQQLSKGILVWHLEAERLSSNWQTLTSPTSKISNLNGGLSLDGFPFRSLWSYRVAM